MNIDVDLMYFENIMIFGFSSKFNSIIMNARNVFSVLTESFIRVSTSVKMAVALSFKHVSIFNIDNEGERRLKFKDPLTLKLEYDPHGLSCKIIKGKRLLIM